jgi:hypothetical protein
MNWKRDAVTGQYQSQDGAWIIRKEIRRRSNGRRCADYVTWAVLRRGFEVSYESTLKAARATVEFMCRTDPR